jgi:hypothetical protein
MIQVAVEASHSHSSASERIVRPTSASRLINARLSFGVRPSRARAALRWPAVKTMKSKIDRHASAARAAFDLDLRLTCAG